MKKNIQILIALLLLCFFQKTIAQSSEYSIELGKTNITQTEPLIITAIIRSDGERVTVTFPELPNFTKKSQSISSKNIDQGNKTITERRLSQEYFAKKAGNFRIPTQSITIGTETINLAQFNVQVSAAAKLENDVYADFIDGSAYDLVDVKDDAFFAISTSKTSPYVGEGFLLTVAFYIANSNKAELDFININEQLDEILKKIRPQNCWENNLNIREVVASTIPVKIGKKNYIQYKIFQSFYYSFNDKTISIPKVNWTMVKFKIAKDRAVSSAKKEDYKTYFSNPINIRPQKVPSNINDNVLVGNFYMVESTSAEKVQTGKSFKYNLIVRGTGNLNLLNFDAVKSDTLFEIFEPKISQATTSIQGKLIAEKVFSFDIVPKKAGQFSLKDYFFFEYFNVNTKKIEELRSQKSLEVVGSKIEVNEKIIADESNDIYKDIDKIDSSKADINLSKIAYNISLVLILAMLASFLYLLWPVSKS